jgi:hypothetical protein
MSTLGSVPVRLTHRHTEDGSPSTKAWALSSRVSDRYQIHRVSGIARENCRPRRSRGRLH